MNQSFRTFAMALLVMVVFAVVISGQAAQGNQAPQAQQNVASQAPANEANETLSPEAEDKLVREVRHELIMLPWYGVFDNLAFRIDGRTVTLEGQVVNPVTKSDAQNAVKRIEGVEKVVNNIEVLPPSPMDDRIRRRVFHAIYSYGPLFKYANMAVPPIHIIVRSGRVTLDGVVDTEMDKNLATLRANQVPGTFQVTNNLRVLNPSSEKSKKKK